MIIGIAGKKKSGKTTVANMLQWLMIGPSRQINFADALKDEVCQAIGCSREYVENHKDNFRLILQGWGTDFRRKLFSENYWVNKLEDKITKTAHPCHFIIADVRFINEAEMVKRHGGTIIYIVRDQDKEVDSHPSEKEMESIKVDRVILNSKTLVELQEMVNDTFRKIQNDNITTVPFNYRSEAVKRSDFTE